MKNIIFLFPLFLLLLSGCYTQLLTSGDIYGSGTVPIVTRDSNKVIERNYSSTTTPSVSGLTDCNCTPYEINYGLCWCVCDRCGSYHRLGYEYCPRGFYSSYGGWDYYMDYPWWNDNYGNRRRNKYQHHEDDYNTSDYPSYGDGGGAVTGDDSIPFVGDRRNHRGIVTTTTIQLPSTGKSAESAAPLQPAPTPTPPPPAAAQQSNGTPANNQVEQAPAQAVPDSEPSTVVKPRERRRLR